MSYDTLFSEFAFDYAINRARRISRNRFLRALAVYNKAVRTSDSTIIRDEFLVNLLIEADVLATFDGTLNTCQLILDRIAYERTDWERAFQNCAVTSSWKRYKCAHHLWLLRRQLILKPIGQLEPFVSVAVESNAPKSLPNE